MTKLLIIRGIPGSGKSTMARQLVQAGEYDVMVEADFSGRVLDLVHEGFDLAIRIGDLPDSSLAARKLGDLLMLGVSTKFTPTCSGVKTPLSPTPLLPCGKCSLTLIFVSVGILILVLSRLRGITKIFMVCPRRR